MITAAWVVPLAFSIEVGLRTMSAKRLIRLLRLRAKWDSALPTEHGDADLDLTSNEIRAARLVTRLMTRRPFQGRACLRQAMTLAVVLRRHQPVLCIGVAKQDDGIGAHAWLEIGSKRIGDGTGFSEFGPVDGTIVGPA